ncbi:MAG: hypothetical protein MI861_10550, partial [Pirellulales bacterium]|nr:hypothetical protein [Pirellulales bacterium]
KKVWQSTSNISGKKLQFELGTGGLDQNTAKRKKIQTEKRSRGGEIKPDCTACQPDRDGSRPTQTAG